MRTVLIALVLAALLATLAVALGCAKKREAPPAGSTVPGPGGMPVPTAPLPPPPSDSEGGPPPPPPAPPAAP